MQGVVWKYVGFQLSERKYFWLIVEADISDALILGIDFLRRYQCNIYLRISVLEMGDGEKIHASMRGQDSRVYHVSRVLVAKRISVPPLSVRYVETPFENPADVPLAVDSHSRQDLFIPSVLLNGSANAQLCLMNMTDHYVGSKRNAELECAMEMDMMVREDPKMDELSVDVYWRGPEGHTVSETLKVCAIQIGNGQKMDLLMEDLVTVKSGDQGNSELGVAAGLPDGTMASPVSGKSAGVCDTSSSEHDVAAGLLDATVVTEAGDIDSSEHKVAAGLSYVADLTSCMLEKEGASSAKVLVEGSKEPAESRNGELPEHSQEMYDQAKKTFTSEEAAQVKKALLEFTDVFASCDLDIGRFTALVHYLKTGQSFPIKQSMRQTPLGFETQEKATLDQILAAGVIEHSHSEWASSPVLVHKRDGSWRYCIDFRTVNSRTEKDAYPLPLIEECPNSLVGKTWFCTLDMNSGYWQIVIVEEDKGKIAFITKFGLHHLVRMPFGLCVAPAKFQRAMHMVLVGMIWDIVIVYLDDINVLGETFDETLANLVKVLARFLKFGLKLEPCKCHLFGQVADFFGWRVDVAGVHVRDAHIKDVTAWPVPKCRKDVEQFLGFINYHREFVQGMAGCSAVLYNLTGSRAKWEWTEDHQQAFEDLKQVMTSLPVLGFPNAKDLFILNMDAYDFAMP